jgi:oligopeptide transport system permease protein
LCRLVLPYDHISIDWDSVRVGLFTDGHLLGTDDLGRDRLARLLVGTRVTVSVALAAALVALVIGVPGARLPAGSADAPTN